MKCSNKNCDNEATTSFAGQDVCNECYSKMNTKVFIKKVTEDNKSKQKILGEY
jgi:hypothetical protein